MTSVQLLVDARGWPSPLDPEVASSILQARLQAPLDIRARTVTDRWHMELPPDDSIVLALITQSPAAGWQAVLKSWLGTEHKLYVIYADAVEPNDVRELAQLTANQPVPRAPYRIAQPNEVGLANAMQWAASVIEKI